MLKLMKAAALAAIAAGSVGAPAGASLLVNGSFETAPAYNLSSSAGPAVRGIIPAGWSAVAGLEAPDILDQNYNQTGSGFAQLLHAQDGTHYLDVNGASPTGGLRQDVTGLAAGATATLSFWSGQWAQNSSGTLTASLFDADTNAVLNSITLVYNYSPGATSASWTETVLTALVPQSGNVRVQFTANSSSTSRGAPGLDNVTLNAAGGVPEPASWAMMIGGLALAGSVLRRRPSVLAVV